MQLNLKNILFLEIFLGRFTSHFNCILTIVHEHNLRELHILLLVASFFISASTGGW